MALFLDVFTLPLSAFSSLLEDEPGARQSTSQLSVTYSQTGYKTCLKMSEMMRMFEEYLQLWEWQRFHYPPDAT